MRGIEEWLRRWRWRLPEDCDPVEVTYCKRCGENVLLVHTPEGRRSNLDRSGAPHIVHPTSYALPTESRFPHADVMSIEMLDRHPHNKE